MEWFSVGVCNVLEFSIVLLQVFGVAALCLCRLLPGSRWSARGQSAVVATMILLAAAGAVCGRHDSEFALFAGGTLTALLIGLTTGGASAQMAGPPGLVAGGDAPLAV
jgi:hypothetical protein